MRHNVNRINNRLWEKILINPDVIATIGINYRQWIAESPKSMIGATYVVLKDGRDIDVKETKDEILLKIANIDKGETQ